MAETNKDKWRELIVWIWVILIVLALVAVSIENQVEKFLGVKRREISETPGKIVQRWGITIIVVIFIFSYFSATIQESDVLLYNHWFVLIVTLKGYQVILEWKYLKGSKQYITTLISLILMLSICLVLTLYS